jgi:hypothetical protein
MKWKKNKEYWRNKQHDAAIEGPCKMGWYRCWIKRAYKICDSLKEAKAWAESVAINKKNQSIALKPVDIPPKKSRK